MTGLERRERRRRAREQLWAERPWTAMWRAYQPPKRRRPNHQDSAPPCVAKGFAEQGTKDAKNNNGGISGNNNGGPLSRLSPFGPLPLRERLDRLSAMAPAPAGTCTGSPGGTGTGSPAAGRVQG